MDLYIKQKVFSFADKFSILDEAGNERYFVKGEVFSVGKRLRLYDMAGNELALIKQKVISLLPKYYILRDDQQIAEVTKEFTFLRNEYTVNAGSTAWKVHGDFLDHEYEVSDLGRCMVSVSKEWFSWGDTYKISILPGVDEILALSVVLVIDACLDSDNGGGIRFTFN